MKIVDIIKDCNINGVLILEETGAVSPSSLEKGNKVFKMIEKLKGKKFNIEAEMTDSGYNWTSIKPYVKVETPKEIKFESAKLPNGVDNYFIKNCKVKCDVSKKGPMKLKYVSWADAWKELKTVDPNANYKVYENSEGLPYFDSKFGVFVKVGVISNGIEHINNLFAMGYKNEALKSDKATAFDINKAIQRCLTKAIALHGIGILAYSKEDLPEE